MFPIAGRAAENAELDTLTISIEGSTNYIGGEEFVVSVGELNNGYNNDGYRNIRVPISYLASYEANEGKSIGTLSNDYWNERNNASGSIYYLPNHGVATTSKRILVGYIPSGEEINGTLTIKAYIDSSTIAISDTYSPVGYGVNTNMTEEELSACAAFVSSYDEVSESVARAYCDGTGNIYGWTFAEDLEYYLGNEEWMNPLISCNAIIDLSDSMGTTSTWVDNRRVLTTEEWNYFSTHPVSFKIKVESQEGLWVNGNGTIDTCNGCKYMHSYNSFYTVGNRYGKTPSVITSGYSDTYFDVIESSGKDYFLGIKLNNNNQVTNAYACGIKDNIPFCGEITKDGSAYQSNKAILLQIRGESECEIMTEGTGSEAIECGKWDGSLSFGSFATDDGTISNGSDYNNDCGGTGYGVIECITSNK